MINLHCIVSGLLWCVLASDAFSQDQPFIKVLGIAQDAGFPQAGCQKDCCAEAWQNPALRKHATSLAVCDPLTQQVWLLDCTPDFKDQLRAIHDLRRQWAPQKTTSSAPTVNGIFLTHAHIGHYAGLIHLGREVMGVDGTPVYAMPRMRKFLSENGPWDQLVKLKNIQLQALKVDNSIRLSPDIVITPIAVPHRDEYSETVGFIIQGPKKSALFIPDIDKWERWDRAIEDLIKQVDVAYLDGTFYGNGEIPGRDLSQIPHPFIEESLQRFSKLPSSLRQRIRFIHLNHTNPALNPDSAAVRTIQDVGCHVARQGEDFSL